MSLSTEGERSNIERRSAGGVGIMGSAKAEARVACRRIVRRCIVVGEAWMECMEV